MGSSALEKIKPWVEGGKVTSPMIISPSRGYIEKSREWTGQWTQLSHVGLGSRANNNPLAPLRIDLPLACLCNVNYGAISADMSCHEGWGKRWEPCQGLIWNKSWETGAKSLEEINYLGASQSRGAQGPW